VQDPEIAKSSSASINVGRIAARSPLLALDHRHGAFQAAPLERYGSPATTETIRRSGAAPLIQRDEAIVWRCVIV
jgi:hypothetical protein